MKYCPNCGNAEKDDLSVYCQNCGTSFDVVTTPFAHTQLNQKNFTFTNSNHPNHFKSKSKHTLVALGMIILVFGLVVGSMFLLYYPNVNYTSHIDRVKYSVEEGNYQSVSFNIDYQIGNVDLLSEEMPSNTSLYLYLDVYSNNPNQDRDSAEKVNITQGEKTIAVSFLSLSSRLFSPNPVFKYNLDIHVNNKLRISDLGIYVSTGNIQIALTNQSMNTMNIVTSTGQIQNSFTHCTFLDGMTYIQTSTGTISFSLTNSLLSESRDWDVKTSTGSINANIHVGSLTGTQQSFNFQTSTGDITLNRNYQVELKENIDATVSTGNIHFDSLNKGKSMSFSNDAVWASLTMNLHAQTSTGNINIITK